VGVGVGPLLWQRSSVLSVTEAPKFDSDVFRYKTRDKRDCGGVGGTTLARSSVLSVTEARKFDSGVKVPIKPEIKEIVEGSGAQL
jgi:hypothetical protein